MEQGSPFDKRRNRSLACLSKRDLELIKPHLERVVLPLRMRLQSGNRNISFLYFPESGLASVVAAVPGDKQAEVGLVGREGMTGLAIVHGADRSPYEVLVQVESEAQRIASDCFRKLIEQSTSMLKWFLLFARVFAVQSSYTALANAHGTIEQRCARWLLMSHDRLAHDELPLPHEFVALMLGVRRAGVTIALQHLEARGLIAAGRGLVYIRNRCGLQEIANGLYGVPEAEYQRLFG